MSAFDPKRTFQSHRRMSTFGGKADMPFCTAKADFDILHSRLKANRFQIGKAVHTKAVLRDLHASKSALPAKPQPRTFAGGVSRDATAPPHSLRSDLGQCRDLAVQFKILTLICHKVSHTSCRVFRPRKRWKNLETRRSPNLSVVVTTFAVRRRHKSEKLFGRMPRSLNQTRKNRWRIRF